MAHIKLGYVLLILTTFCLCFQFVFLQRRGNDEDGCCYTVNGKHGSCGDAHMCTSDLYLVNLTWPHVCIALWQTSKVCCNSKTDEILKADSSQECEFGENVPGVPNKFSMCTPQIDEEVLLKWTVYCRPHWDQVPVCCSPSINGEDETEIKPKLQNRVPVRKTPSSGAISKRKCAEYSRAPKQASETCLGLRTTVELEADPLDFPHIAHLGYEDEYDDIAWTCGGSLISENFILTAAHCVTKNKITMVRLGASARTEYIPVDKVIVYPGFTDGDLYDNIALIKLSKKVKFNSFKRPACLNSNRNIPSRKAMVGGWMEAERGVENTNLLFQYELPIVDSRVCNRTYKSLPEGFDDETLICAGKAGICKHFSGTPLQIESTENKCMASIIGVTAFGMPCEQNQPNGFIRVSAYIPWIESTVWPNGS